MTAKSIAALQAGLRTYGVTGKVSISQSGGNFSVKINDAYYGVWDTVKETFVD